MIVDREEWYRLQIQNLKEPVSIFEEARTVTYQS